MTLLDQHRSDIERMAAHLNAGDKFSLRTLYGGRDNFENAIPSSGHRKALGTQFRSAVESGEFPAIAYSHHAESPAEHWYARL